MSQLNLERELITNSPSTNASHALERPITVLVVDDHALIRTAISQILIAEPEVKQVMLAQDYAEAEERAAKMRYDVIWLDLHVGRSESIAEVGRLHKLDPDSHIMAIDDSENEQEAFAAILAGAQGYCSKQDLEPGEIMGMLHRLCRGEFVLRPGLAARLMQRLRLAALPLWGSENGNRVHALLRDGGFNGLAELTTREREILQLISQGYRDRDIGGRLYISEKTVQKHVQSILGKLGVQNRTEAAYLVHRHAAF